MKGRLQPLRENGNRKTGWKEIETEGHEIENTDVKGRNGR